MKRLLNRRNFIRNTLLATTGLAASTGQASETPASTDNKFAPAQQKLLPAGKLGELNITRLILGGNLLTRVQHARDLRYIGKLVKSYNTDSRIRETIELAEASGINTLSVNVTPAVMMVLNDHRKNGGKIQTILYSTADIENPTRYAEDLRIMTDFGTEAIYIWGVHADKYVAQGKWDIISKGVETIKALGVPCGLGAHDLLAIKECERTRLPVDFYIKTLHHHKYPTAPHAGETGRITAELPGYWCNNPDEVIAFMKTVTKPWIAFKIMAAGAIPPQDAFSYAFNSGADFALAGMFDFDIVEDCQIMRNVLAQVPNRARPWRA
jgi:hypothetical protein